MNLLFLSCQQAAGGHDVFATGGTDGADDAVVEGIDKGIHREEEYPFQHFGFQCITLHSDRFNIVVGLVVTTDNLFPQTELFVVNSTI